MLSNLKEINNHGVFQFKEREKERKIFDALEEFDCVSYLVEIIEEMNCLLSLLFEEFVNSNLVVDSVRYCKGNNYLLSLEDYHTGEKIRVFIEE